MDLIQELMEGLRGEIDRAVAKEERPQGGEILQRAVHLFGFADLFWTRSGQKLDEGDGGEAERYAELAMKAESTAAALVQAGSECVDFDYYHAVEREAIELIEADGGAPRAEAQQRLLDLLISRNPDLGLG